MILVENVRKRYGNVQALRGVDFRVARGETFGIIGPNGAGKSTVLKIMLGLVHPDAGSVVIDGVSLRKDPVGARRHIGYVPQKDGFDDQSTGGEALAFLARLRDVAPERIEAYTDAVGVRPLLPRKIGTLSGGQRQRLSLAAALLGDPPVLLLDEPTASLDPRATADFRTLVERLASEGRTIVLCSHLLADVERLCHRVLILLDGRVEGVETGRVPAAADLHLDVDASPEARAVLERFRGSFTWKNGSGLTARVSREDQVRLIRALDVAGVAIRSLETRRPSLEDRFLAATNKETHASE